MFDVEIVQLKNMIKNQEGEKKQQKQEEVEKKEKIKKMQIASREMNMIKDLEVQMPKIKMQVDCMAEMIQRIPIMEEQMSKLSSEVRNMNLQELEQRVIYVELNKLDKDF